MSPQRIQMRRTKGWRLPAGAIYVGRPSPWGNPYKVGERAWLSGVDANGDMFDGIDITITAAIAVALYRSDWQSRLTRCATHPQDIAWEDQQAELIERLRGRDLACWCPLDQPCHADVLLEIANTTKAAA